MISKVSKSGQTAGALKPSSALTVPAPAMSVWERLKQHKVAQWTLAYAAVAYTLLHGTQMVRESFEWPHLVVRVITLLLFLGLPLVATLAWYHGHRGKQRMSRAEIAIIAVLLVIAGTLLWQFARPSQEHIASKEGTTAQTTAAHSSVPSMIPEKSIAVLPFVDMSEKKDQEYFADGMAEEILNLLVTIPELKVIGRTSSFQFKGKADDLRKIGTALGSAYVVEGSVRRSGDHVRVTAQLIDTRTGAHRWSQTYDREASDVFEMQGEIAASLARALQLEMAPSALSAAHSSPRSPEAYDLYLRGLHASGRFDERGFEEAVANFRRALELDPSFVPAAEELANNLGYQTAWYFMSPEIGWGQVRKAAEAALRLDPKSARGHAFLGSVYLQYDWDWVAARQEFKTAAALGPTDSLVLQLAALERLAVGEYSEALKSLNAAVTVDPLDPNMHFFFQWIYVRLGRLSDAERAMRHSLGISPTYAWGPANLGMVLVLQSKAEEALAEVQRETDPGAKLWGLAIVYAALHRRVESDAALSRYETEYAKNTAMSVAQAYAFRGETDQAFKWLDTAYAQKDTDLYHVKGDPLLKPLETDPRYKAFLRKMKLPE
jgi:adenylate cyclase